MYNFLSRFITATAIACTFATTVQGKEFVSDIRATDTLELYTSEGCSSCPPADRWFTSLKQDARLFKDFIPLAFHVDYWNYLGWADRFSAPGYTARQHKHVAAENVSQSYTPQVVLNNQEWRGHLRGRTTWDAGTKKAGVLSAVLNDNNKLMVSFAPATRAYFERKNWTLNTAYLGMGLTTAVQRGENAGRELKHDFVVLHHQQQTVASQTQKWQWEAAAIPETGQQQTALVVWLSDPETQQTLQAVGGYL